MLKNVFYIAIFTLISWGSYQISYPSNTPPNLFYQGVFMENIIKHVNKMTQGPRAVGDYFHDDVQRYLITQLKNMGWRVSKQKSTSFNPKNRTAAPIRNIIAKKAGSDPDSQDLLIMAHYDAAKFSATGAGDDASGVAVILENLNAFIKTKQLHSNGIIVLFTDAEEMGLLGAHAFINEQLQNHDIGLIINLEARGSSGPVMMWPETIGGNRSMIENFSAANVPMPVTTSLHYEIYRMLPNDTDLTPFNQLGKINGFNLAFIDDHFNYHTKLDTQKNLSLNTLAHQSIQLHSMLRHFSNIDLNQMYSEDSLVYFSLPVVGLISYPTWLTWVLLAVFGLLFSIQVLIYSRKNTSSLKVWLKSFLPIILSSILAYGWCWLVLLIVYASFPEFKDILQGFPYQGHAIMGALLTGSALIAMAIFGWFNRHNKENQIHQSTINIILWLILLLPINYFMPGSGLLVWPVLMAIILMTFIIHTPKLADQLAPIFAVCSFILLGTVLINLPIALGVGALPLTAVILTWLLALFAPVISPVRKAYHGFLLLILPTGYLAFTLLQAPSISKTSPHPTSLSYLYDHDIKEGYFFNYDAIHSGWNEALFDQSQNDQQRKNFQKSYKKPVKNLAKTNPTIQLKAIDIKATKPLRQGRNQIIDLVITAHNNTEVIEIFTNQKITLHKMSIEGRNAKLTEPLIVNSNQRLLQYYFNGKKQIEMRLEIEAGDHINWQIQSHSLDLLTQPEFNIPLRPSHQIPKPFIKSDNAVVVQSFVFGQEPIKAVLL